MSDNTYWLNSRDMEIIQKENHWAMQSIEAHEAEGPIGPDFTFLCQWMNTAWNTTDEKVDKFMQNQVCPHNMMHKHFISRLKCMNPHQTHHRSQSSKHKMKDTLSR